MSLADAKRAAEVLVKETYKLHARILEVEEGAWERAPVMVSSLRDTGDRVAALYATAELLARDLARVRAEILDECVQLLERCEQPAAALAIQLHKLKG